MKQVPIITILALARRYLYLREHHLADMLKIIPTTDTNDVGLDFAIDQEIWRKTGYPEDTSKDPINAILTDA